MEAFEESVCTALKQSPGCLNKFLDWFITFRSPIQTWNEEPTFLFIQTLVILSSFLNYLHARSQGGRYVHYWWSCIIVSLVTECICYAMPEINNFWHAQGMIMLFGKRFPLYIVLIYNAFWYTAFVVASRARLSWWAEPFAIAVLVVLLDLPYDIMGIKMLWWTWHDTDACIFDRHYDVPWTSYYFHSAFVVGLTAVFFGSRKLLMPSVEKWGTGNCILEWLCTFLTGCLAMPVGSCFFMLFYTPLHDWYGLHSEVPVLMWLSLVAIIAWISDRNPTESARTSANTTGNRKFNYQAIYVYLHFIFFAILVYFAKPENVRSTGLHQMTGPCNVTEESYSQTGEPFERQKYFCTSDFNEPLDWHCLPGGEPPADYQDWYTVCGTPFPNAMEYRIIVWFCCLLGLLVYSQFLFCSGEEPSTVVTSAKSAPTKSASQKSLLSRKIKQSNTEYNYRVQVVLA